MIEYPPHISDDLLLPWNDYKSERCEARTSIDREGMNDLECSLVKNHPSSGWHYYRGDRWSSPVWWKNDPTNLRTVPYGLPAYHRSQART